VWKKEAPEIFKEPEMKAPEKRARRLDAATLREKVSFGSGLQTIWEKITTTKSTISKREKTEGPPIKSREKYETLRMSTGEEERMKRIDYR
jgi:hypothetical protein